MIDIYNRLATDQNYSVALETEDEIEMILAQIKMVLGTNTGDVLGSPYFGVDIKRYIFSMSYNEEELNQMITDGITSCIDYNKEKYNVAVTVDFGKDHKNASDYAVINIQINQTKMMGIVVTQ